MCKIQCLQFIKYNEREKIVCACEDFTDRNHILYEFENLALSTNPDKKIETELDDIMDVIDENKIDNVDFPFSSMFIPDGYNDYLINIYNNNNFLDHRKKALDKLIMYLNNR